MKKVDVETVVVQHWATQWIESSSLQTINFSGDGKESTKVSRAVGKIRKSFTLAVQWNLANLVFTDHGSLYVSRSSIFLLRAALSAIPFVSDWWLMECCAVTIQLGLKMVGWFHRMPLSSARCPRILGRWENSFWTANWRTVQRPRHSVWCNGWISSCLCERP